MTAFKVLLVYPNPRKMSLIPVSMALFATLLKNEGVTVDLFDTSFYEKKGMIDTDEEAEKYLYVGLGTDKFKKVVDLNKGDYRADFRQKVREFQPDLLAVTCVESSFKFAISLLKEVREEKILTILGGVFATFSPEYALSCDEIDIVCVGEGEEALVDLVKNLRSGADYSTVNNLYIKKNGQIVKNKIGSLVSLDKFPLGDFKLFNENRFYRAMAGKIYKMAPIETHRGCTHSCTFCNSPLQNKIYKDETGESYFRAKSIKNVYNEIKYFVDTFKVEYLFFWADNFFVYPLKTIEEFCEMYSEFKLPFYCQSYPNTIDDRKLVLLKNVGLHRLGVGIEQGNEEFRKNVIKRNYSNSLAVESLQLLKKHEIHFSTNNIIGFPDETPELVMDTVELNREVEPDVASCSIFTPFRGTPLRELALKKGYLEDRDLLAPTNADMSVLNMPQFTKEQIEGKRRTFELYIKFSKNRWKEIALAEKLTSEGDKIWESLSEEYHELYDVN